MIILSIHLPKTKIINYIGQNTLFYIGAHSMVLAYIKSFSEVSKNFAINHSFITSVIIFFALVPLTFLVNRYLPFLVGKFNQKTKYS